jgi:hypothetical protein
MHGVNSVKFISAQQARKVYQHQNIKGYNFNNFNNKAT